MKSKTEINSSNLNEKNYALNLAEWISNVPLMYYPSGLQSAAVRFKNSMQENAKTHTIIENVVEDLIMGLLHGKNLQKYNQYYFKGLMTISKQRKDGKF